MFDKINFVVDKVRDVSRIIGYGAKVLTHIADFFGSFPRADTSDKGNSKE